MHDALSAVQVLHPQTTEFFTPATFIQQGSKDGPIPHSLERARGVEQVAGLHVAECRQISLDQTRSSTACYVGSFE